MKRPKIVIVTSNKGGSGKTPVSINLVTWALSQDPPLKVLAVDINHTNQDMFHALRHLHLGGTKNYESAFSLDMIGTGYYLPVSDDLHLLRQREFQPLSRKLIVKMLTDGVIEYAEQKETPPFEPDLIVVDGNYCYPSYLLDTDKKTELPPTTFMNIWSITSPHELRIPTAYKKTIRSYKDAFEDSDWDKTNFVHVFSILEKERKLTAEVSRLIRLQRSVYTVSGSDDLADLYKKRIQDSTARTDGFSFDQIQREIFSPMMAEIGSLMIEDPSTYSEDTINERWVERVNIFLTKHRVFPLNILPMPHYYPYLRKTVVDMILRERIDLEMARKMFGAFYKWIDMFFERYFAESA